VTARDEVVSHGSQSNLPSGHYRDGVGVAKDEQEAVRWFRMADQGYVYAQYDLGLPLGQRTTEV